MFCDVSKAFESGIRVFYLSYGKMALKALHPYLLLEWLNNYLSQRKQKVGLKSCFSCLKSIFAGCRRGLFLEFFIFGIHK